MTSKSTANALWRGLVSYRQWNLLALCLILIRTTAFAPRHPTSVPRTTSSVLHATTWTEQELQDFALSQGVNVTLSTLGPGYRAVARAKHNSSLLLGYCEGFLRPGGKILHLDKMEVFRRQVLQARESGEFRSAGTMFGVGLLMGYLCLLHGQENGYTVGEFLAIDDEEKQHRKLVRYYERSGFEIIKYVGDDFGDIPDRLVWGGCGTLMRQDIDMLLQSWTAILQKSASKQEPQ